MGTLNVKLARLKQNSKTLPIVLGFSWVLPGCAGIHTSDNDSDRDPYKVSITREAHFDGDIDSIFTLVTPEDILPKVLTGYGPIPAVVGTTDHQGQWGQPGAFRIVRLADGSTVKEQLTQFNAPDHFAYRVWEFDNRIIKTLAVGGADGNWQFTPTQSGTQVRWTYTFYTNNYLKALPLSFLVGTFWRGYMDVCFENLQALAEDRKSPE